MVAAVIPAAGVGARLGAGIPKAFVELGGVSLLQRSFEALRQAGIERIVIAVAPEMRPLAAAQCPGAVLVDGGAERVDSVRCALEALDVPDDEVVLVHDAARALVPVSLITSLCELPAGVDCVVPVLPVSDTVKTVDADGMVTGTPPRASLRAVQTPQACRAGALRRAFALGLEGTDDASLIEAAGGTVATIPGDQRALKITHPVDIVLAEHFLALQ
ncbi:2-C-methyl-D-erythritol 4-phosphate cytidylyltransferase [Corynebacterium sp. 13CS0277]|uniref:2-C-methyl-D-erythritol 4-phosphate cytidylyltransferase n=1 Tax=Corynebacterium sp. 13CS0277 TaxID=2071994 RepID=UPI000D025A33|nr:2-C-methyl-D-erythritol 4-phosphate cytidylyltransferase [Corynebacterium sp. 13CS0277]PRQ11516.1 2-C-methyl-D-erythritol 4-phosphate cytidylyltransferase [Corynebacterium sp. 13CS0277]